MENSLTVPTCINGAAVREDEILSPVEIRRLIDAAKPGLERTLFSLAAATGARSGELLGVALAGRGFRWAAAYRDPAISLMRKGTG
jgi:hypothetical protein